MGAVEVVEQQPTAAVLLAVSQQLRSVQALLGKQTRTLHFTLKMPRSLAAHQQLGQHRPPAPDPGPHITLARQYPQQAEQLQISRPRGVGQGQADG